VGIKRDRAREIIDTFRNVQVGSLRLLAKQKEIRLLSGFGVVGVEGCWETC
jgi:hypothetical protein